MGATYASPAGEAVRQSVKDWIRTSGAFDGGDRFHTRRRRQRRSAKLRSALQWQR